MSQRNPMNDRNQQEHKGQTRKSAASAKPASSAGYSVIVKDPEKKTAKEKKAEDKAKRAEIKKSNQIEPQYYNPPTKEYKNAKRLWWITVAGAIILAGISFALRESVDTTISIGLIVVAYLLIVFALYLDLFRMKKMRRAYQNEMRALESKSGRANSNKKK